MSTTWRDVRIAAGRGLVPILPWAALLAAGGAGLALCFPLVAEASPEPLSEDGAFRASPSTAPPHRRELTEREMATIEIMDPAARPDGPGESPEPRTAFVWSRSVAKQALDEGQVALLVAQGKADTLESRLRAEYRELLKASISNIDRGLADLGDIYVADVRAAKASLMVDPTRCIRIRTSPRERDPNYPLLLAARREIEQKGLGAVWGDYDRATREEVHLLVRWSEWPNLRGLIDCQVSHVQARRDAVRNWITRRYYEMGRGYDLFEFSDQQGERR